MAMDLNILKLTKLEVKYNKLLKTNEAMKKKLELQGIQLKVVDNNIEQLKKTLAGVPTTKILGKKDDMLKEKDDEIS